MAAVDMFERFTSSLSEKERASVKDLVGERKVDLLSARSEDARMRIVSDYVAEVHRQLKHPARKP